MTDTKTCPHCGKVFHRPAEAIDSNWNRRRFCAEACARAALIAKAKSGNQTPYKASNSPITRDEAERFVALLNAGVGMTEATMRVGRANGGRMMLAAIKHGLMDPPPPPQPEPEPKPRRTEPLAAGADETWGVVMPGIKWADAQRQIANMRAY